VADDPPQSPEAIGFNGFLPGADGELSNPLLSLCGFGPASTPRDSFQRHRPSHFGMDGTAFDYYHGARTQMPLEKNSPQTRPVQTPEPGSVFELPEVGGLHHRYERPAA